MLYVFTLTASMQRSDFTTRFTKLNRCQSSFRQWHFEEGMCFVENKKWWTQDDELRHSRHEGVDFCCYVDQNDAIIWLNERTKIPVLYDGLVAEVFNDFLGQSVLVRHPSKNGRQFCSIYAHIVPDQAMKIGDQVRAGQCIGQCASGKIVSSHLHLSTIWLPTIEKAVDWQSLIKLSEYFVDPLIYI